MVVKRIKKEIDETIDEAKRNGKLGSKSRRQLISEYHAEIERRSK